MTADPFDLIAVTLPDETALDWQDRAACATTDPDMFFPESSIHGADAKKICATCDVATQCLAYAISNGERYGIWGGLNTKERTRTINGTRGAA